MNRYKVKVYTKWFQVPTSLSVENVIQYRYVDANSEEEALEKVKKMDGGRFDPFEVTPLKTRY